MKDTAKQLNYGYTTGACATVAVRAALKSLLLGIEDSVETLLLGENHCFELPIEDWDKKNNQIHCGVRKYSGDDPDVTNHTLICADVTVEEGPVLDIQIDGGQGVGRITKPGLDQPVGNAAINSGPRRSITEEAERIAALAGFTGTIRIVISVPEGEALAEKTFNPKLGIVGGISILGTTGLLVPMSEQAIIETIRANLSMVRALGHQRVVLVPGNIGEEFAITNQKENPECVVQVSNFIGDSLLMANAMGFDVICLVGHLGKLIKLAGRMMNTHSRYGDCRKELMAAYAAMCGCSREGILQIMTAATTDSMLEILRAESGSVCEDTFQKITEEICANMVYYIDRYSPKEELHRAKTELVIFASDHSILGSKW